MSNNDTPMDLMKMPLEERNTTFAALPSAQKAIEVAKDVLAQIEAAMYLPQSGTYLTINNWSYFDAENTEESSLQPILEDKTCNVCAIGAAFASCVRLQNQVKVDEWNDNDTDVRFMSGVMKGVFTYKELSAMETVFEGSNMSGAMIPAEVESAIRYRNSLLKSAGIGENSSRADRILMGRLMHNVINNGGAIKIPGVRFYSNKHKKK